MIRTRDFLLYLLVFVFLIVAIVHTISEDIFSRNSFPQHIATFLNPGESPPAIVADEQQHDREAYLASLREKIARGEGQLISAPPVLTSVDTPLETETEEGEPENQDMAEPTDRKEKLCAQQLSGDLSASRWPQSGITMRASGTVRVFESAMPIATTATSGEKIAAPHTLLSLPLAPTRGLSSACIDSPVIGVATDMTLIKNEETWRFRSYGEDALIGYARDGFPIYGQKADESVLDSCGGYDTGAGYQYHLREKELFILGCFAAPPSAINNP